MKRKVFSIRVNSEPTSASLTVDAFDSLVDEGYDDILVITPTRRYIASIDEWLDYSYIDLEDDVEVRVLPRSYMGRA